jgi:hypothetical protein
LNEKNCGTSAMPARESDKLVQCRAGRDTLFGLFIGRVVPLTRQGQRSVARCWFRMSRPAN